MKRTTLLTLFLALAIAQLYGCAAVVVAGAATAATVAHDRRTAGRFMDDQTLELQAESRIRDDQSIRDKVRINVTSINGIVLLTGEAETKEARNKVLTHVRKVEAIRRIHDYIRISPPADSDSVSDDVWITTKIKTKQTTSKGVDPSAVKVVTSNRVVYLMGLVGQQEAKKATEIARTRKGVNKVVKLFEYTD
ncbi:MAG: BON domain-containing protein [Acidiferrobacterales bacterium]